MLPENNVTKIKLDCLTSIRGIAAWWVVFYHFQGIMAHHTPSWVLKVFSNGYLAVDLFFILSGFVLFLTYYEQIIHLNKSNFIEFYFRFLIKRISRIYPLHILILFLYLSIPVSFFLTDRTYHGLKYSPESFLYNILLIQNWLLIDNLTWNIPSWSISAEWFSYLLFPVFGKIFIQYISNKVKIFICSIVLVVLIFSIYESLGATSLGSSIQQIGPARCLLQFLFGGILLIFYKNYPLILSDWRTNYVLLLLFGGGIFAFAFIGIPNYYVMTIVFGALILFLSKNPWITGSLLNWRPLVFIGEISYSTYMWHFLLRDWFKLLFVDDSSYTQALYILSLIIVLFIISIASYYLIEKPAQLYVVKFGDKLLVGAK